MIFGSLRSRERAFHTVLLLMFAILLSSAVAIAGTGGTEFTEIYTTFQGWAQGFLGKTIAVSAFLVGMAIGITQQSLMSIAIGIGAGIAVYYTPNIIDAMVTAMI